MQRYVGIVRSNEDLHRAEAILIATLDEIELHPLSSVEAWEARNLAQVGWLIVQSALHRKESRGLHYTLDYPEPVESERHDTVLSTLTLEEVIGDEPATT